MLRINTIHEVEDFFHKKKCLTLDAIGRESSEAVVDIYIRGFFRQIIERLMLICPDLPDYDAHCNRRP